MKLTTYTDFGLRTLMYLATLPEGELSSVAHVSKLYDVSRNHLVKVVNQLAREGYVRAIRGKNGGIRLAQAPQDINVGQVIRALENNLEGIDCGSPACYLVKICRLKDALKEAMEAFIGVMEGYTLADLVSNREELMTVFAALEPVAGIEVQ
ncbi:Rrf2 family transcriptional regulator [Oceanisphaera avium]|uniref:Transcriptional repressor NsrR n=1 Tax=Oceanisphaera avium TaxID=1903694 RepID=A0A1Y0CXP5_9GAMM|nr:Rrf2 family transcriptional regulator [Oceanisphaera avium]ART80082.1 transcriptional repressor NsrR [Oceanisphaera avium]